MMYTAERIAQKISSIWLFMVTAYGFTWLVWLPGFLSSQGIIGSVPWQPLFALGACGPFVAAVCCLYRTGGWKGVRDWLSNGFMLKVAWGWWAFVLLAPFLIPALVLGIYARLGGPVAPLPVFSQPWMVLPTILLMVTIGGGQEEYGWRGYLFSQLEKHRQPWQADLLMAAIHSVWHLPLFFIGMTLQSRYSFWVFLAFGFGFTLLANQIYRRTKGSLLAVVGFHGLVNTGLDIFPLVGPAVAGAAWPFLLVGLLFALLALAIRFTRRIG